MTSSLLQQPPLIFIIIDRIDAKRENMINEYVVLGRARGWCVTLVSRKKKEERRKRDWPPDLGTNSNVVYGPSTLRPIHIARER